jgi:hypothetical protein
MKFSVSLGTIFSLAGAIALPAQRLHFDAGNAHIEERTPQTVDPECVHGPTSRQCWSGGYSIATDFDLKHPETTVTRSYTLTITNTTCNPDGNGDRLCQLINGQYPGPTSTRQSFSESYVLMTDPTSIQLPLIGVIFFRSK